jgi:TRAP-type C4-dicarboxylate transport system permease small subunit
MTNPEAGAAMSHALIGLGRINGWIEAVLAYLAGLCLGTFTLVVLVDVIYRQVLAHPLMWPSEWAVMTFVWSVLLGASVAARRRAHFVVEVLPALPAALDYALRVLVALLTLVFALVLLYFGLGMTLSGMRRFTPMMGYPMVWVFAAFPLAGVAFTLFGIEHLLEVVGGRDRREQAEA